MPEEFLIVGKRLPRVDSIEKAKGEAEFTSDIQLRGMLYARFLRSPHAHAKITKIDTKNRYSSVTDLIRCIQKCSVSS